MNTWANNQDILVCNFHGSIDKGVVLFKHGIEVSFPLRWFPDLEKATREQLDDWEIIGKGEGFHWPQIDADISAEGILFGKKAYNYRPFELPLPPEKFKEIRTKRLKLSQKKLGELTGFSETSIRHFESGRRKITKRFEIVLSQLL